MNSKINIRVINKYNTNKRLQAIFEERFENNICI